MVWEWVLFDGLNFTLLEALTEKPWEKNEFAPL